jgi:hypothetical protein
VIDLAANQPRSGFIGLPEYRATVTRSYELLRQDVALQAEVKRETVRLELANKDLTNSPRERIGGRLPNKPKPVKASRD